MSQRPVLPTALLKNTQALQLAELNDQQFWNYAEKLAQQSVSEQPAPESQPRDYIECVSSTIEGEAHNHVMLPLASLREILPVQPRLTSLPASPIWLAGLMAWHGETIAIIDLAAYLSKDRQPQGDPPPTLAPYHMQRFLIAQEAEITLGLAATIFGSTPSLTKDQIEPLDSTPTEATQGYYEGIEGWYARTPVLHMPTILTFMVRDLIKYSL